MPHVHLMHNMGTDFREECEGNNNPSYHNSGTPWLQSIRVDLVSSKNSINFHKKVRLKKFRYVDLSCFCLSGLSFHNFVNQVTGYILVSS